MQLSGKPQPLAHAANAIVLKLLDASGCMPQQPTTPSAGLCTWSYLHPKSVCLHAQPQLSRSNQMKSCTALIGNTLIVPWF